MLEFCFFIFNKASLVLSFNFQHECALSEAIQELDLLKYFVTVAT